MTLIEYRKMVAKKKPSKYSNQKTPVDGIVFDSKKEAKRFGELKLLEKAGKIEDLELQVSFPLIVNGKKVCVYKCDFWYKREGQAVVEDVKGMRTPAYRIKAKLFEAIFGFRISEI